MTGPTLAPSAAYQRRERNIMLLLLAPAVLVVTALLLAPLPPGPEAGRGDEQGGRGQEEDERASGPFHAEPLY